MSILDFVNEFLKNLIDPVAIIWLILIVFGVFLIARKRYRPALIIFFVVVFLTVFGGTGVSGWLLATLERPYYRENPLHVPNADIVFVLGGHVRRGDGEPHGFDARESADRLLAGVALARAGKAKVLLIGGGGAGDEGPQISEYAATKDWLESWNLPVAIEHLGILKNTYEEVRAAKTLMEERQWQSMILVTSASHIRRAEAVCQSEGIDNAILVACDFHSLPPPSWCLIPDLRHLSILRLYLYEQVGWLIYRWKGWIDV